MQANPVQHHSEQVEAARQRLLEVERALNTVILGKRSVIESLMVALLAEGHILLEDIPGLGKTTLAKAFAHTLDCEFRRIQFTPDLLPSDVIGTSIYSPKDQQFHFQQGPVFTQILMADEINRASPRTQSSLLEAMAERQVSTEGQQRFLPRPFLVIATQNPLEYHGTYPLPEAQLDRFMMSLELGYPDNLSEIEMLYERTRSDRKEWPDPILSPEDLLLLQNQRNQITVHKDLAIYLMKIVQATRNGHHGIQLGVSPRGSLALFQAAQARALLKGREQVVAEDIFLLAGPVLSHRLIVNNQSGLRAPDKSLLIKQVLAEVPTP